MCVTRLDLFATSLLRLMVPDEILQPVIGDGVQPGSEGSFRGGRAMPYISHDLDVGLLNNVVGIDFCLNRSAEFA